MNISRYIYPVFVLLVLTYPVKAQQTVSSATIIKRVKLIVQEYIKSDALYPKSYIPVKWSSLSTLRTLKGSDILKKTNDEQINSKIDSLIALEATAGYYPDHAMIYTISHAFKLKTRGAGIILKVYTFHLDYNLNIIDVDRGSPEDQIEKSKQQIERAEKEEVLIKEISRMEIENIRSN